MAISKEIQTISLSMHSRINQMERKLELKSVEANVLQYMYIQERMFRFYRTTQIITRRKTTKSLHGRSSTTILLYTVSPLFACHRPYKIQADRVMKTGVTCITRNVILLSI